MTHVVNGTGTRVFHTRPLEPDRKRVRVEIDIQALDEDGKETSFDPSDYVTGDIEVWVSAIADDGYHAAFDGAPNHDLRIHRNGGPYGLSALPAAGTDIGRVIVFTEGNA